MLRVSVVPDPVQAGKPVTVTVHVVDSVTGAAVHGDVLISNAAAGQTGVPFVCTFRPSGSPSSSPGYPVTEVTFAQE
jgi:hypothetical protein